MRTVLTNLSVTAGIVMAVAVSSTGTAQAAHQPVATTTISLIGSNAVLGITDTGQTGPTPGDIRTLSLTMSNPKGAPVGRAEIVQTLTRQQGDVGTALKSVMISLPKGTIAVTGVVEFVNFTDPTSRPNDATEHLAVVGGTGAYRGASGEADIAVLPGFTSRWTITLDRR